MVANQYVDLGEENHNLAKRTSGRTEEEAGTTNLEVTRRQGESQRGY